jgi:hypothetical protein
VVCAMVCCGLGTTAVLAVLQQAVGPVCQVSEQTQNFRWGQMYTSHDRFQINKLYS